MKKMALNSRSIRTQMKRMLLIMSILFVVLCILINHSMQRVLLSNASEYAEITSKKLQNELEFLYDKMDVFSMSIAGEREVQQLMQSSYAKKAVYIAEVEEKIAYFKVLDPEIVDISLVNEEVHYSTQYTYKDLDSIRKQSKGKPFSWIGIRYSSMYTSIQRSPMLLYAREIVVNGEDVGTLLISINISSLQMDNSNEMDACYLLADEENVIYSFDSTENRSDEIWKIWRNYNGEEENDPLWYIQSRYLEKMGCYHYSAVVDDEEHLIVKLSNVTQEKKLVHITTQQKYKEVKEIVMSGYEPEWRNSFEEPQKVAPKETVIDNEKELENKSLLYKLPGYALAVLVFKK